jgi:hypothetical protein
LKEPEIVHDIGLNAKYIKADRFFSKRAVNEVNSGKLDTLEFLTLGKNSLIKRSWVKQDFFGFLKMFNECAIKRIVQMKVENEKIREEITINRENSKELSNLNKKLEKEIQFMKLSEYSSSVPQIEVESKLTECS